MSIGIPEHQINERGGSEMVHPTIILDQPLPFSFATRHLAAIDNGVRLHQGLRWVVERGGGDNLTGVLQRGGDGG